MVINTAYSALSSDSFPHFCLSHNDHSGKPMTLPLQKPSTEKGACMALPIGSLNVAHNPKVKCSISRTCESPSLPLCLLLLSSLVLRDADYQAQDLLTSKHIQGAELVGTHDLSRAGGFRSRRNTIKLNLKQCEWVSIWSLLYVITRYSRA